MTVHGAAAHTLDRSAAERDVEDTVAVARTKTDTRVLVIQNDSVPVTDSGVLRFLSPSDAPGDAVWGFLGRDAAGAAVLVAAIGRETEPTPGAQRKLRELSADLDAGELETAVVAVSLARWLIDAPFCPACGERCELRQNGWSRRCGGCEREHFPRTDPAVIVTVGSADGEHLLLGANAIWGGSMFSCFAGFVEAGESLEETVHREIQEEAGVRLTDLRYSGSQAWPYPRSLMVGFHATAVETSEARPDGTEIVQVRWFTHAEIDDAIAGRGEVRIPGRGSIAGQLIEAWRKP